MIKKQLFVLAAILFASQAVFTQARYSVLIQEIMADPSPAVGLPAVEWIELINVSGQPVSVAGWRLRDLHSQSGAFPTQVLAPGEILLVSSASAATTLSAYGPVLTVSSFPSLDNEGDLLSIIDQNGQTIHAVRYSLASYQNELKIAGGWSLEMRDTDCACIEKSNWQASTDPSGGTPGRANASRLHLTDTEGPRIIKAYLKTDHTLLVQFNEPIDSSSAVTPGNFRLPPGLSLQQVTQVPPLFDQVEIGFMGQVDTGLVYELTVKHIRDCKGLPIDPETRVKWGKPSAPQVGSLVLNEVLFYPKTGGADYVEIYNRGSHIINTRELFLANRQPNGDPGTPISLQEETQLLFPGEYWVVTTDSLALIRDYWVKDPTRVRETNGFPSLPTDKGSLLLLHIGNTILDELNYDKNWHSPLLNDQGGIALERIDPDGITQDPSNWHSAASTSRWGTPGYLNSQNISNQVAPDELTVDPVYFSPDNNGIHDFTSLQYRLKEPGQLAHVRVFDRSGRMIRFLVNGSLTGAEGRWTWDGLGDDRKVLPPGPYIILAEFISLSGKRKTYKTLVTLVTGD